MFKLKLDVNTLRRGRAAREGAAMKSIHRSVLTRALMTGVASLAFLMVGAGGVRAEIVTVQGDDGPAGEDGVNPGDNGMPGDDGESVSANAGSTQPITAPLNKGTATGGNGGAGGNGAEVGSGGGGGGGGSATAFAGTSIVSGVAEADAAAFGGLGNVGGSSSGILTNGGGRFGRGSAGEKLCHEFRC
jgi:hypothetical protein